MQSALANADVVIFTTGSWYRDVSWLVRKERRRDSGLKSVIIASQLNCYITYWHPILSLSSIWLIFSCFTQPPVVQGPPKSRMYYHGNVPAPGISDSQAVHKVLETVQKFRAANKVASFPVFLTSPAAHTSCNQAYGPWSISKAQSVFQFDYNAMIRKAELLALAEGATFPVLDVSYMSLLRPDAHSAQQFAPRQVDCTHWCVPGVPDTWLDFLYTALGL